MARGVLLQQAPEREYPSLQPARVADSLVPEGTSLRYHDTRRCHMQKRYYERVWVPEFGGGHWVYYPVRPALNTVRQVLKAVVYGCGYQGPQGTRSTTGTWTNYPGL